jgi:hypothetical protein
MALGSTQSNRNEYQESFLGKGRPTRKADNLTATALHSLWFCTSWRAGSRVQWPDYPELFQLSS